MSIYIYFCCIQTCLHFCLIDFCIHPIRMKFFILCIGLICFILFLNRERFAYTEGFADLDNTFLSKYNTFMTFYNTFMTNWMQAIITSLSTNLPAEAPSSDGLPPKANKESPPQPTMDQLNQYIQILIKKEGKSFPPITAPMPKLNTTEELIAIKFPTDIQPFQNALDWMNMNMSKAHATAEAALQSVASLQGFSNYEKFPYDFDDYEGLRYESLRYEPFEDICQQISSCQAAENAKQEEKAASIQKQMGPVFDKFLTLQPALNKNTELIVKSKKLQDQAKNGTLLPAPAARTSPYKLPPGSDALQNMERDDPEKYKKYKQNFGQFMSMKQSFDGINSVLR